MTKVKKLYEAPATTVVQLKFNGILCQSIPGGASASMNGTFEEIDI